MQTKNRHDPEQRTFYQFAIYSAFYTRCLARMYMPRYHLSISDWKVLAVLAKHPPMSATEAGKRTSLKPDKVTRAVDSLTAKGLIDRRRDPDDGRRIILSTSPKGRRAFAEIDRVRYAIESEFLDPLNEAELRQLYRICEKLDRRADELFRDHKDWKAILDQHDARRDSLAAHGTSVAE